jgi:hypothetical protein
MRSHPCKDTSRHARSAVALVSHQPLPNQRRQVRIALVIGAASPGSALLISYGHSLQRIALCHCRSTTTYDTSDTDPMASENGLSENQVPAHFRHHRQPSWIWMLPNGQIRVLACGAIHSKTSPPIPCSLTT